MTSLPANPYLDLCQFCPPNLECSWGQLTLSHRGQVKKNGDSGVFVGGMNVLARAQVAASGDASGVLLKIAVRSDDPTVSRMVADCIR